MRSLIPDMPTGRELNEELDSAIAQMMAISVERIGSAEWQNAVEKQQRAFCQWREYLQQVADDRVLSRTKEYAQTLEEPSVDEVGPLLPLISTETCLDRKYFSQRWRQQTM